MIDFVAIDFETANEKHESVCAIGLVVVGNGEITTRESWLICPPELRFKRRNTEIHGIRKSDVKDKGSFLDLWPKLSSYLSGRIVVAHNAASVEVSMLRHVFAHFAIDPPNFHCACTCCMARAAWPDSPGGFTLPEVADYLSIAYEPHDPAEDAMACALTAIRACREMKADSIQELSEKLRIDLNQFSMMPASVRNRISRDLDDAYDDGGDWEDFYIAGNGPDAVLVDGFSADDIKACCSDAAVFKRGKKLFNAGKVEVTDRGDLAWAGKVASSGVTPYDVNVDRLLSGKCPCKAWINSRERFCKHTVALALAWLAEGGPPPTDALSEVDRQNLTVALIDGLADSACKQLMLDLAERQPDMIRQLIVDEYM